MLHSFSTRSTDLLSCWVSLCRLPAKPSLVVSMHSANVCVCVCVFALAARWHLTIVHKNQPTNHPIHLCRNSCVYWALCRCLQYIVEPTICEWGAFRGYCCLLVWYGNRNYGPILLDQTVYVVKFSWGFSPLRLGFIFGYSSILMRHQSFVWVSKPKYVMLFHVKPDIW